MFHVFSQSSARPHVVPPWCLFIPITILVFGPMFQMKAHWGLPRLCLFCSAKRTLCSSEEVTQGVATATLSRTPFVATHFRWQGGTAYADYVTGAAAIGTSDGSVVLCGYTDGNWWQSSKTATDRHDDFAVVALSSNGTELWRWQVRNYGAAGCDRTTAAVTAPVSLACRQLSRL